MLDVTTRWLRCDGHRVVELVETTSYDAPRCHQTVVEVRAERASKPREEGTQPDQKDSCPNTEIPLVDKAIPGPIVSVAGSRFLSMSSATDAPEATSLDVRTALLEAAEARRTADQQEARLLALAVQIVHLHPVDETTCTATWNPSASLDEEPEPVAGTGTPLVAEQAVEELGAALGISYLAALGLVTDALELRYRLPRLWALVQAGPAAGVEGPQGRSGDHPSGCGGGGVRRRPGRDRRGQEPDHREPGRAGPRGPDPVRTREGPRPRGSRPKAPRGPLRLPTRRGRGCRVGHRVRPPGCRRRP